MAEQARKWEHVLNFVEQNPQFLMELMPQATSKGQPERRIHHQPQGPAARLQNDKKPPIQKVAGRQSAQGIIGQNNRLKMGGFRALGRGSVAQNGVTEPRMAKQAQSYVFPAATAPTAYPMPGQGVKARSGSQRAGFMAKSSKRPTREHEGSQAERQLLQQKPYRILAHSGSQQHVEDWANGCFDGQQARPYNA